MQQQRNPALHLTHPNLDFAMIRILMKCFRIIRPPPANRHHESRNSRDHNRLWSLLLGIKK